MTVKFYLHMRLLVCLYHAVVIGQRSDTGERTRLPGRILYLGQDRPGMERSRGVVLTRSWLDLELLTKQMVGPS